jgi:hypothetical protein
MDISRPQGVARSEVLTIFGSLHWSGPMLIIVFLSAMLQLYVKHIFARLFSNMRVVYLLDKFRDSKILYFHHQGTTIAYPQFAPS